MAAPVIDGLFEALSRAPLGTTTTIQLSDIVTADTVSAAILGDGLRAGLFQDEELGLWQPGVNSGTPDAAVLTWEPTDRLRVTQNPTGQYGGAARRLKLKPGEQYDVSVDIAALSPEGDSATWIIISTSLLDRYENRTSIALNVGVGTHTGSFTPIQEDYYIHILANLPGYWVEVSDVTVTPKFAVSVTITGEGADIEWADGLRAGNFHANELDVWQPGRWAGTDYYATPTWENGRLRVTQSPIAPIVPTDRAGGVAMPIILRPGVEYTASGDYFDRSNVGAKGHILLSTSPTDINEGRVDIARNETVLGNYTVQFTPLQDIYYLHLLSYNRDQWIEYDNLVVYPTVDAPYAGEPVNTNLIKIAFHPETAGEKSYTLTTTSIWGVDVETVTIGDNNLVAGSTFDHAAFDFEGVYSVEGQVLNGQPVTITRPGKTISIVVYPDGDTAVNNGGDTASNPPAGTERIWGTLTDVILWNPGDLNSRTEPYQWPVEIAGEAIVVPPLININTVNVEDVGRGRQRITAVIPPQGQDQETLSVFYTDHTGEIVELIENVVPGEIAEEIVILPSDALPLDLTHAFWLAPAGSTQTVVPASAALINSMVAARTIAQFSAGDIVAGDNGEGAQFWRGTVPEQPNGVGPYRVVYEDDRGNPPGILVDDVTPGVEFDIIVQDFGDFGAVNNYQVWVENGGGDADSGGPINKTDVNNVVVASPRPVVVGSLPDVSIAEDASHTGDASTVITGATAFGITVDNVVSPDATIDDAGEFTLLGNAERDGAIVRIVGSNEFGNSPAVAFEWDVIAQQSSNAIYLTRGGNTPVGQGESLVYDGQIPLPLASFDSIVSGNPGALVLGVNGNGQVTYQGAPGGPAAPIVARFNLTDGSTRDVEIVTVAGRRDVSTEVQRNAALAPAALVENHVFFTPGQYDFVNVANKTLNGGLILEGPQATINRIEFRDVAPTSEEITLRNIEIHSNDVGAAASDPDGLVTFAGTGGDFSISNVRLRGRDAMNQAQVDADGGRNAGEHYIGLKVEGGSSWGDFTADTVKCENLERGIQVRMFNGAVHIARVFIDNFYQDCINVEGNPATGLPPTSTLIEEIFFGRCLYRKVGHNYPAATAPHPDRIQLNGSPTQANDWGNITIRNTMDVVANPHDADLQGIFLTNLNADKFFTVDLRNNLITVANVSNAVRIIPAQNTAVNNMTSIHADLEGITTSGYQSRAANLRISGGTGNTVTNTVFDTARESTATEANLVETGEFTAGADIPFNTLFAGPSFNGQPQDGPSLLARFAPIVGPLMAATPFDLATDAGCIDENGMFVHHDGSKHDGNPPNFSLFYEEGHPLNGTTPPPVAAGITDGNGGTIADHNGDPIGDA